MSISDKKVPNTIPGNVDKGQLGQSKGHIRSLRGAKRKLLLANKRLLEEVSGNEPTLEEPPRKEAKKVNHHLDAWIRALSSPYNCSLCAAPGGRQAFIKQQLSEKKKIPELICHTCKEKIIDFELLHSRETKATERCWFLTFNKYWFLENNKKATIILDAIN